MKKIISVSKGTHAVSADPDVSLAAASLGSGLAIAVHDPVSRVGGLLVSFISKSSTEGKRLRSLPALDPGLPELMKAFTEAGGKRESLRVHLVGAGQFLTLPRELSVGEDLYRTARRTFEKNGVRITGEHVGGPWNRSMVLHVADGAVSVSLPGGTEHQL